MDVHLQPFGQQVQLCQRRPAAAGFVARKGLVGETQLFGKLLLGQAPGQTGVTDVFADVTYVGLPHGDR